MAATPAVEDDESWLYGESIQEEKAENDDSERHVSDGAEDTSNQDESSRVSRFSSDDLPTVAGKQDRSNDASSPTPSSDLPKRALDDKEAGELSGEEENAAPPPAPEKEDIENNENADGTDGVEEGAGDDGETAPPGTAGSEESDSDDDSVQVTIGDIKAGPPAYGYSGPPVNLNIKRGGAYQTSGVGGQSTGKGKGVDLESVGMINGVPTYEFNLDSMEDKPWRKPGADITDYFNYGFNEDTWKAYCEKQRKLRLEANGTLGGLAVGNKTHHTAKDQQIPVATVNENSKYAGALGKKAGPPPGRKISGSIDVIGASTTTSRRAALTAPKENVIQVVTADKREYSRKPFIDTNMPPPPPGVIPPGLPIFPDLSMPPPGMPPPGMPPPGIPPPNMPMLPGVIPTFGEPFDAYNRNYPPPPGVPIDRPPPGFDNSFDGSYFNGSNSGQDPYNPFEPTGDGPWESRDGPGSRYHKKDWDYHGRQNDRSPQRSPNDEEYEQRRHREYRERDRDRSRDRDRERERERHSESRHSESRHSESRRSESRHKDRERDRESRTRDYESEERRERDRSERGESERRHREHRDRDEKHSRSSRRKHREETDETSEHRSSRHKRKRAKREKEEEASATSAATAAAAGGTSSAGGGTSEANESQEATAENQDEDSQPE